MQIVIGEKHRRRNAASIKTNRHPNIFPLESVSRFPSPYCLSIFTGFPSIFKNPRPKRRDSLPRKFSVTDNGFPLSARLVVKSVSKIRSSIQPSIFLSPPWVSLWDKEKDETSSASLPHLRKGDVSTSICAMIISIRWIFSSMLWVSGLLERNRCHGNAENRANRSPPPSHAKPRHAPVNRTFLPNSCVISDDDSPRNSHRWNSSYSRVSIFHQLSSLFKRQLLLSVQLRMEAELFFIRTIRKRWFEVTGCKVDYWKAPD